MDDILLADVNADTLEENVWWSKKNFALLGITNCSSKVQRGDSINHLGYTRGLQKIQPQEV